MNILLITNLAPKWAGNQSLTRTLNGLAEEGHAVHVLSIRPPMDFGPAYSLHPNITIEYRRLLPGWLRAVWVPFRTTVRGVERRVSSRRPSTSATDAPTTERVADASANDYNPGEPESGTLRLITVVAWLMFQFVGLIHGVRLARRHRFDLFYGYEVSGARVAYLLGKLFRRPVATRFQGTYIHPLLKRRGWWLNPLTVEHWLAMKTPADLVIMGDDGTRGADVLQRIGVPGSRVLTLTNGVDFDVYDPGLDTGALRREMGLGPDTGVLLTVSKLARWKRVDRAIEAMPAILRECPDTMLIVVGDGTELGALQRLAKRLGVDPNVTFTRSLPHGDVVRYLHLADIFLSLYDLSNRGNPLLEAMVCARCIVTLDDGSVADLIHDGDTGVLVPANLVEDRLPAAVVDLLKDPEGRLALGSRARARAQERLMSVSKRLSVEARALESIGTAYEATTR